MKYSFLLLVIFFFWQPALAQEDYELEIPEPLMFDLVRGLGAKQGELEINALADFPFNNTKSRAIEWAPEVEYALFDGFAVELEFPFEDGEFEAFKFAVQYTIGACDNHKFIHGLQLIGETFLHDAITEFSLLYIPGYRFNEVWSTLGLFGLMYEVGADANTDKRTTVLLNVSMFADVSPRATVGLEINNSDPTLQDPDNNEMIVLLLPQFHYDFYSGISLQLGIGPRFIDSITEYSGVVRLIKTF